MTASADVVDRIPHRHPMLLLDDVSAVEVGTSLRARVRLPDPRDIVLWAWDEFRPFPPALLLESFAQAAVLLSRWDDPNPDVRTGTLELLTDVRGVEFPAPARPGALVEHEVTLTRHFDEATLFSGCSRVDDAVVCRVDQIMVVRRTIADLAEEER